MNARDDYPYWPKPSDRRFKAEGAWHWSLAMDEIDLLRAQVKDADATIQSQSIEIELLNARLEGLEGKAKSPPFCSATHPDTECEGWLWCCSLIAGHLGPHHCAGAAW